MTTLKVVTHNEIDFINSWMASNKELLPPDIGEILNRLSHVYWTLAHNQQKQKNILSSLRQAMGIIAKSEKGSSEKKLYRT